MTLKRPQGDSTASSHAAQVQRKCSCGGSCDKCKGEQSAGEHGKLQRKPEMPQISRLASSSAMTGIEAPPIVHEVLRSPGQPLDAATRAFFEPRFGLDFGQIRIHADQNASESGRAVSANAYTVGEHIVFRTGQYQPNNNAGKQLLAHELAHSIQQERAISLKPRRNSHLSVPSSRAASTYLQRDGDKYAKMTIKQLRKLLKTDPEAAEALRQRFRSMSNQDLERATLAMTTWLRRCMRIEKLFTERRRHTAVFPIAICKTN